MMPSLLLLVVMAAEPAGAANQPEDVSVVVGAKSFTESIVLARLVTLMAGREEISTQFRELAGTRLAWSALLSGDIDLYPEYTGTIRQEILAQENLPDDDAIASHLLELGIGMTRPLGFNNSYELGMPEPRAEALGIVTISDLRNHPDLRMGFSNEFMDRDDGWPSLRRRYQLPQTSVSGMEHGVAYLAADAGSVDVIDLYTTDPNIRVYDFRVLEDDLGHFPQYDAVYLYRQDLAARSPRVLALLKRLEGGIDADTMLTMNQAVELRGESPARAAAGFLRDALGMSVDVQEATVWSRIRRRTVEHLFLVAVSLTLSIVLAVPLGVLAYKNRLCGQVILGTAEIIQTVPGLALLVFMGALLLLGGFSMIGALPVIIALFLYALLPIIRNTVVGLNSVPRGLRESAEALGLPPLSRLRLIELPMASPTILAGIKTAAVINVGYAALGGLIGAGGYGQPIMTGLRLNSMPLMMEGAVPAAFLALAIKGLFELSERWLVPQGLRLREA